MLWAICQKLHDYLYATLFEVETYNNPLTYALTSAKVNATGLRWIVELSLCNSSITGLGSPIKQLMLFRY